MSSRTATHAAILRLDGLATRITVGHHRRDISWRRFGSGSPIVLLHGGHGSWLHWVRNIQALAQRHTVWVPDLPGFGDSDDLEAEPHAPDRLERLVEATASTLDSLVGSGAQIDLAGFSFGGLIAARLTALRGDVRRLVLLGPAGHGGARRQTVALQDWRLHEPSARIAALRHNLGAFMLHEGADGDALALAVYESACANTRFRSKAISANASIHSSLDQFANPLLLIWGEHDVTALPNEAAKALTGERAERDWCVVPGAAHWVQYERHLEVNALLLRWFGV